MSQQDLLSLSDAAKQYKVPVATLRTAMQRGYISGQKIGNQWVVTRQVIEGYLSNRPARGRPIRSRD
jgi:hypothetical protein